MSAERVATTKTPQPFGAPVRIMPVPVRRAPHTTLPPLSAFGSTNRVTLEREADLAAERIVGASFALAGAAAREGQPSNPSVRHKCVSCARESDHRPSHVQRKCSACEPGPKDKDEERLGQVQRARVSDAAPPQAIAGAPIGVLVDEGATASIGQQSRSAFMADVRQQVMIMCSKELEAVGRSAEGCPYLARWLDYYDHQSAAHIERAIRTYTSVPAGDSDALLKAVVSRVRGAVRTWAATGAITGIPGGVSAAPGIGREAGQPGAVQTKALDAAAPTPVPRSPTAILNQLGPGQPLGAGVRGRMERGLGRRLDDVRVHTGGSAARLARELSARAFTVGRDVAFGANEYRPGTIAGDLLIAHELAHTIQQRGAKATERPLTIDPGTDLEADADRAATGMLGAELGLAAAVAPVARSGLRLQGCTKKAKACPPGLKWWPTSTVQYGSLGCTCLWKCVSAPSAPDEGLSFRCPPDSPCEDPFTRVGRDYTAKGYGASFTQLGEEPACGCFALDIEGNQQSDQPLVPVTLDTTAVVGPLADAAQGLKNRRDRRAGSPGPQTDPTTGQRIPDKTPDLPRPENPVRARAIQRGIYTPSSAPRLERLFRDADPAVMIAMENTIGMPDGAERGRRVSKLLDWADARPSLPETIQEGETFGKGGTGSVAAVVGRPDLASKTGAGRAGPEAAAMVEMELAGVPTVYLGERQTESGASRLVLRRIDGVGSKETLGRSGKPPEDPMVAAQNVQYITPKTIGDLEAIRQKLADAHLNVGDFQFIIRKSDGAVFMNDPTGVTPNSEPSGDITNIIERTRAALRRRTEGTKP